MKLADFQRFTQNNPKITGLTWRWNQTPFASVGFRLNRSNSFCYYNFIILGEGEPNDEVLFDHIYSQNTGKTFKSFRRAFNALYSIGYFNEDIQNGKLTRVEKRLTDEA